MDYALKAKELREQAGELVYTAEKYYEEAKADHGKLTDAEVNEYNRLIASVEEKMELAKEYEALDGNKWESNLKVPLAPHLSNKTKGSSIWETKDGNHLSVYAPGDKISRGKASVGIGQIARAMLTGARNEAEKRALAEGTDSSGGFTVPSATLTEFFDQLRSKSRVVQAGARTINLETDETTIARVSGDPSIIWHEENAQETDSDVTFEGATFKPKTLMILVKASRELISDSVNANDLLSSVFAGTVSAGVDAGILFGTNANGQMKGLTSYNLAEVDMGENGAALTNYDPLVQAYRKQLDNNSSAPTAYIMAPREWETLATLKDNQDRYLDRPQALDGIPFLETTNIPTDETHGTAENASRIVTGNFGDLVIGLRQSMRIELLRERFADSYQFGFLVHMRVDALPAREESFSQITGIIPGA